MGETIPETIGVLLENVQDEVDDPEVSFKLRTARQLMYAWLDKTEAYEQALNEADLPTETTDRLRDLGYLD